MEISVVPTTVPNLSNLKLLPQPNRNRFKLFISIFKNIAHSFKPGETPSNSASQQAPNYVATFLNIAKHGEKAMEFKFTGTGN